MYREVRERVENLDGTFDDDFGSMRWSLGGRPREPGSLLQLRVLCERVASLANAPRRKSWPCEPMLFFRLKIGLVAAH